MAASVDTLVDRVLNEFNQSTSKPEHFLSVQNETNAKFKSITKDMFDFGNQNFAIKGLSGMLPELYTDGFDEEQIWQQLELHNEPAFNRLMKDVSKLLSFKGSKLSFQQVTSKTVEPEEDPMLEEDDMNDEESINSELSDKLPSDSEEDVESDSDGDWADLKLDEYKVLEDGEKGKSGNEQPKRNYAKTEVDDQFFKVREMEEFLEKEEKVKPAKSAEDNDDDEDEDGIDFFADDISDEDEYDEAVNAKYKDFFKGSIPPGKNRKRGGSDEEGEGDDGAEEEIDEDEEDDGPRQKRVKFNFQNESDEESEVSEEDSPVASNPAIKSSFEQRQERLATKIRDMEDEAVAPKPWQLMGETKAELRPENALLEEDLFFDHMTREAPVITEETTRTLEDIIRQRIKDKAFDDVERKIKPVYDPTEYKKKLVLDQEKSKFSLAEIYEQEYLKQQEVQEKQKEPNASSLADPLNDKETDDQTQIKITKMIRSVFTKLDALCNFHYTPRAPAPEVKIVSNMPSIAMEEIAPVTVSDANLLAPEEVQDPVRGEMKGKTEREKTDRLRERRKKKATQRVRQKERERVEKAVDKANPGLGNKHSRARVLSSLQKAEKEGGVSVIKDNRLKVPKSSSAFFARLQEEVTTSVDTAKRSKTPDNKKKRVSGSHLKL